MLIFAGAMLVTVTATTLALLLMGWEVMGAASYALIGYWWRQPRRVTAANVAFLTTRAADLGLYVAAGAAMAGGVSGLALAGLPGASPPWLDVVTAGVVLAAFGKSAQLPFSFWLSRAMEGPSPVSALLHSATMVAAGAYLLLRTQALLAASGWGAPAVAWTGAVTALVLGLVAVAQADLKQLLAASTCAQVGFMVLAAGAGGVAGGVMQLVAHAAVKSLLFLAAGAWLTALGTKQLAALRGAARQYPLVGAAFTVGALTLAGLPPVSLWVTKDEVLAAALHQDPALYATGLAAAVVSAVYSIKALWYVWQPVPAGAAAGYDTERPGTRRVAPVTAPPLVVLAVAAAHAGRAGPAGDRRAAGPGARRGRRAVARLVAADAVRAARRRGQRADLVAGRRRDPGPGGGHRLAGAVAGPGPGRARPHRPSRPRPGRVARRLRRPGPRPRRRIRSPAAPSRWPGPRRGSTTPTSTGSSARSRPGRGGSGSSPAGRRPGRCTPTTPRPPSRSRCSR